MAEKNGFNETYSRGGGYSPIKVTGVLVENHREHPLKVPESCFMGVSQICYRSGGLQCQGKAPWPGTRLVYKQISQVGLPYHPGQLYKLC